jgi:hypothetical protein
VRLDRVSGLLVQQVPLVHTNTDYCLPTFYTWIPTTRGERHALRQVWPFVQELRH